MRLLYPLALLFALSASAAFGGTFSVQLHNAYDSGHLHIEVYWAYAYPEVYEMFDHWTWSDASWSYDSERYYLTSKTSSMNPLSDTYDSGLYKISNKDNSVLEHTYTNLVAHFRAKPISTVAVGVDPGEYGHPTHGLKNRYYTGQSVHGHVAAIIPPGWYFDGWQVSSGGGWGYTYVDCPVMYWSYQSDVSKEVEHIDTYVSERLFRIPPDDPNRYPWGSSTHSHSPPDPPPDPSYIIAVTFSEESGMGSATPENDGWVGTSGQIQPISFSATPEEGCKFDYWIDWSGAVRKSASFTEYIVFPAPRTTKTVYATACFSSNGTYRVDTIRKPGDGGWTSGDGVYGQGAEATVRAVAADGYKFKYWTDQDGSKSYANPCPLPMVKSWAMTAHFVRRGDVLCSGASGEILCNESGAILYSP